LIVVSKAYGKNAGLFYKPFIAVLPITLGIAVIVLPVYYFTEKFLKGTFTPSILSAFLLLFVVSIIFRIFPKIIDQDIVKLINKMPFINKIY